MIFFTMKLNEKGCYKHRPNQTNQRNFSCDENTRFRRITQIRSTTSPDDGINSGATHIRRTRVNSLSTSLGQSRKSILSDISFLEFKIKNVLTLLLSLILILCQTISYLALIYAIPAGLYLTAVVIAWIALIAL